MTYPTAKLNWNPAWRVIPSRFPSIGLFERVASPEDFEKTLFTAVDAGHDADTVAAMACSVSGAYRGSARLPKRLVADLEYHDRLVALADDLSHLHLRLSETSE